MRYLAILFCSLLFVAGCSSVTGPEVEPDTKIVPCSHTQEGSDCP